MCHERFDRRVAEALEVVASTARACFFEKVLGECGDVRDSGLGAEVVWVGGVGTEHAEEVAELAEGLPAGVLDIVHGLGGGLEVMGGDGLRGAGLDGHHGDSVSDDVVEFAGDPGAFVRDRPAGSGMLFGIPVLKLTTEGGWYPQNGLLLLSPSAFFLIGFFIWALKTWKTELVEEEN